MEFDKSKVYTALNADKLKIGSKMYVADDLLTLQNLVEIEDEGYIFTLEEVKSPNFQHRFSCYSSRHGRNIFAIAYLLEEPEESKSRRMTYRKLSEWLAKGNGQYTLDDGVHVINVVAETLTEYDDMELLSMYKIRRWDSDEWIEPTIDVYIEDC